MSHGASHNTKGQGGLIRAALFGLCPRCTARALWDAPAAFAQNCRACGLAFGEHEPKGRVLYLVLIPVTALLMAGVLALDDALRPPLWLLFPALVVLVPLAVIAALRFAKVAILITRLRAAGVLR